MATVVSATEPRTFRHSDGPARIVLRGISWELYEMLRENEDNWHVRMAYDGGELELMSPSRRHEEVGDRFTLMLVMVCSTLGLPCKTLRSTTWKKPGMEKGKEADCCFYLESLEKVRRKEINLEVDPPPDLAVEVEISRGDLDILAIYSAIGVPEVWRYDGATFHIHLLQPDGSYLITDQSAALPFLRVDEVVAWLDKAADIDNEAEWIVLIQVWARAELIPRLGNG